MIGPLSSSNTAAAAFTTGATDTRISGAFYFPNGAVDMSGLRQSRQRRHRCMPELIGSQVTLCAGTATGTTCTGLGGGASRQHGQPSAESRCRDALLQVLKPQENAGVAAIEFAIYALVFLMIVAATVDIGPLIFTASQLDAAVSAGAQYAENKAAALRGVKSRAASIPISRISSTTLTGPVGRPAPSTSTTATTARIAIVRPEHRGIGHGAAP